MSYAMSAALQSAIFERLALSQALREIVGGAIYDAVPAADIPATYVVLGEEVVRDRSDADAGGAWHDFTVSVLSDRPGFQDAKYAAGAICDALTDADLPLSRGRLVGMWFRQATARRVGRDTQRRIDLRFRAQTEDT